MFIARLKEQDKKEQDKSFLPFVFTSQADTFCITLTGLNKTLTYWCRIITTLMFIAAETW